MDTIRADEPSLVLAESVSKPYISIRINNSPSREGIHDDTANLDNGDDAEGGPTGVV
jgi:hypothetical protein